MNNLKLIIGAIVVMAVSVLTSYFVVPGFRTVVEKTTTEIGGGGADFQTNWFRFGGVLHSANSMTMKQATSTPCRIQAPSSTSTLVFASADFRTGSTTEALGVDFAKTTNALSYATTTAIGTYFQTNTGNKATIVASTTPIVNAAGATVFNPNDWLVVGTRAIGYGDLKLTGSVPVGTCKAEWIVN